MSKFANWTGAASRGFTVTPSDTVDFAVVARALYIGGAGAVTLLTIDGDVVDFQGLPAGTILPVSTRRVNATGTNATNIRGLY